MDIERRLDLIEKSPTEEVITRNDLRKLLETKSKPGHYSGYEVSGKLHLGTLLVTGSKINDFTKAGVKTQVYFAHYHSLINNKLGGDWENLKLASDYYKEAFKFVCPGVKVVQATDLYRNNDEFWLNVLKFSKKITLARATRCLTIMGRSQKDKLDLSQYFYPSMQAVDIKTIAADIAHGGMDQRSAHVLAREVYPKLKWKTPVAVHHHLIPGLAEPVKMIGSTKEEQVYASKMSKSKPWTCIFIHDSKEEIKSKISKAWCPLKQANNNPVLEILKYVVFPNLKEFGVPRAQKFGGNISYTSYLDAENDYLKGKLHPADLKSAISENLDQILRPVRRHFEKRSKAKLLDVYKKAEISR